jgi:hypothetical protein
MRSVTMGTLDTIVTSFAVGYIGDNILPQFLQTLEGDYHVILQRIADKVGD